MNFKVGDEVVVAQGGHQVLLVGIDQVGADDGDGLHVLQADLLSLGADDEGDELNGKRDDVVLAPADAEIEVEILLLLLGGSGEQIEDDRDAEQL